MSIPLCKTCDGWGSVTVASDVISRCGLFGRCPDCVTGRASEGPNRLAFLGRTITRCKRIACYNQRNGRECWDAEHVDGSMSYEWESRHEAQHAANHYTYRDIRIGVHRHKFC